MAMREFSGHHHLSCPKLWNLKISVEIAVGGVLISKDFLRLVKLKMGLDYSYTQPSESEDYHGGNSVDRVNSETEDLIRRDQAEITYNARAVAVYPPQPEVEFGFPQTCYCGAQPILATATTMNDPGRRYYTSYHVMCNELFVMNFS
ncbi:hypothetical protein Bca101_081382 [Brassica carinata]